MRGHVNALKITLVMLCFMAAEELKGQACQGCTCAGSSEVHPAATLQDCIQGCSGPARRRTRSVWAIRSK